MAEQDAVVQWIQPGLHLQRANGDTGSDSG
jgi:hypothetical protein